MHMALYNFYTIVNFSGKNLQTIIDNKVTPAIKNGEQSTGHLFDTGEDINVTINGHNINLFLPDGSNSWSTIVFSDNGSIHIFPSSPKQLSLSY